MKERKTIYYTDELNDEFSKARITPRKIDKNYIYCHTSRFKRFTHFFWYRIIAMPLAFLYTKLKFSHKIVGADSIAPYADGGYFLYGNHTQDIGDALIPSMINKSKDKYVIAHPNNVSMPILGRITPSLGALPLPDDLSAHRSFTAAIKKRIDEGCAVVIYPEAHIWPYYTKIRPFTDISFAYPIKHGVPTFCFTNTYKKRRLGIKPRIVTYVDGPFFPDPALPPRDARKQLRDRVYDCMCRRSEASDAIYIQYVKKED